MSVGLIWRTGNRLTDCGTPCADSRGAESNERDGRGGRHTGRHTGVPEGKRRMGWNACDMLHVVTAINYG